MKISNRTRTIILWCISIGLLLGMVITFTPTMGLNLGGQEALRGTVQMTVNGAEVREADVLQLQQQAPFNTISEGPVATQLERLLVDTLIRQEVERQAAAPVRVSGGEVRDEVNEFRESRGVAGRGNDRAYLSLIGSAGFNDEMFRNYIRDQLKYSKWRDSLVDGVAVSDAEVEAYYESHKSSYQSEERVRARQIVVEDAQTAEDIETQLAAGASFADLAAQHSIELAVNQGAVGAQGEETEPRAVGRAAFPTAVANAAFGLRGAGTTDVVEAAGGFYIVQVLEYLPSDTRPLDEVRDQVAEDALAAKQQGVVEAELERLRNEAVVAFPETSTLQFENEVVAEVGDAQITEAELDRATYFNPVMQQALTPDMADLIEQIFRPNVLQQLISTELAYQGAQQLDAEFVGTKAGVAQAALNYVARDATVTDDQVQQYYESNVAAFTLPAEATVTQATFTEEASATAFRQAVLGGAAPADAAAEQGGQVTDHGRVRPGDLESDLDTAVFQTDAFDLIAGGPQGVSDVLVLERPVEPEPDSDDVADEAAEAEEPVAEGDAEEQTEPEVVEEYVVLVVDRTDERVRPLEDVRAQVENQVLATNRQQVQQEWLDSLRDQIEVHEYVIVDVDEAADELPFTVPEPGEQPAQDDGAAGGEATDEAEQNEAAQDAAAQDAAAQDEAGGDDGANGPAAGQEDTPEGAGE